MLGWRRNGGSIVEWSSCLLFRDGVSSVCGAFAAAPAGLSIVNSAVMLAESWKHPEDQIAEWRHKAQMCAEVLVPDGVPATYIKNAYVASPKARDVVNALNIGIAVRINNKLFFA